jgi:hypothetical protein
VIQPFPAPQPALLAQSENTGKIPLNKIGSYYILSHSSALEREFDRMKLTRVNLVRNLLISSMALLALAGCAGLGKWKASPSPKPAARPQAKPVDPKAQQHYYDIGLQQYSKENYGKAKEAFQQVVDFGPNTALGEKAQENLKKIQQILKTLEELEIK